MILQALNNYYQRLLARKEPGLAPFGYSPEKISYAILLLRDGQVAQVDSLSQINGKKLQPAMLNVPQPEKRTVGIKPNFLWDKTSYVLGVSATSKRADKEHEAFKSLHLHALAGTDDPGLRALRAFLAAWTPDQFASSGHFSPDMLDANFVFRLEGETAYLHERPAAQLIRARLLAGDGDEGEEGTALPGTCLVTGEQLPLARLHPAIKGVNGAQSSGASIVSFNLDAFGSYGKSQGDNAPVSEPVAFAYTTVLNHLLRRSEHNRQRLQIGDATVVFWAEAADVGEAQAAESLFSDIVNPTDGQETVLVHEALEAVGKGRPLSGVHPQLHEDTRMYVLALAPNASRISIRFWHVDTLGSLTHRLAQHAQDLQLVPAPWRTAPPLWRLALATAPSRLGQDGRYKAKSEDVLPQLAGELARAILGGGRYPASLLANVIMRMRSDGDISGVRVAICKAVIVRNRRLSREIPDEEEVPVSLDKQSTHPAYRLGRLFAVLEAVQRNALGGQVNATIRDRYYGAASATPASVFPMLVRNAQNHLSKLRKEKRGLAVTLEKDIREIVDGLAEQFPRSLRMHEQGRFAIGYYHQSQARFAKGDDAEATAVDAPSDVTNATQEGATA